MLGIRSFSFLRGGSVALRRLSHLLGVKRVVDLLGSQLRLVCRQFVVVILFVVPGQFLILLAVFLNSRVHFCGLFQEAVRHEVRHLLTVVLCEVGGEVHQHGARFGFQCAVLLCRPCRPIGSSRFQTFAGAGEFTLQRCQITVLFTGFASGSLHCVAEVLFGPSHTLFHELHGFELFFCAFHRDILINPLLRRAARPCCVPVQLTVFAFELAFVRVMPRVEVASDPFLLKRGARFCRQVITGIGNRCASFLRVDCRLTTHFGQATGERIFEAAFRLVLTIVQRNAFVVGNRARLVRRWVAAGNLWWLTAKLCGALRCVRAVGFLLFLLFCGRCLIRFAFGFELFTASVSLCLDLRNRSLGCFLVSLVAVEDGFELFPLRFGVGHEIAPPFGEPLADFRAADFEVKQNLAQVPGDQQPPNERDRAEECFTDEAQGAADYGAEHTERATHRHNAIRGRHERGVSGHDVRRHSRPCGAHATYSVTGCGCRANHPQHTGRCPSRACGRLCAGATHAGHEAEY